MFKHNCCVYETCKHYTRGARIYGGHFVYAQRALCCTMALSHHFFRRGGPMDSIREHCELANFDDFSIIGFPLPTGHYAQKIRLIDLFEEHLKIKMKTVDHTPVEKIIELFVSMISDCPDVKSINNHLVPDKLAVAIWGQKQFADQSQISEVLHQITAENLLERKEIFQKLFCGQSLSRRHPPNEWPTVDVDMSGLSVSLSSRTYEKATFRFMQKEKGKDYKLTCSYTLGEFGEVFEALFDPGAAHCTTKLVNLLLIIEKRVGSPPGSLAKHRNRIGPLLTQAKMLRDRARRQEESAQTIETSQSFDPLRQHNPHCLILIREDARFDTIENVMLLSELGYDFLLQRYSPQTARLLAKQALENQWIRFNPPTLVAELDIIKLLQYSYPARFVLKRSKSTKSEPFQYFHLVNIVPERVKDSLAVLNFYLARKIIEAFIKTGKNVLNLRVCPKVV
ncbi:hypothetical protein KAV79_01265 [Candidatus Aerophobetes bacterium]|nr:hypothetical protein [Candidatus Aerophobetes bacterium]